MPPGRAFPSNSSVEDWVSKDVLLMLYIQKETLIYAFMWLRESQKEEGIHKQKIRVRFRDVCEKSEDIFIWVLYTELIAMISNPT